MHHRFEGAPSDVVVIGGGSTGAAVCYHLSRSGVGSIICVEAGRVGVGDDCTVVSNESEDYFPFRSGTGVFESNGPNVIKQVVTVPPYSKVAEFAMHHGFEGVRNYLRMAAFGRDLELELANMFQVPLNRLGSIMVGRLGEEMQLLEEYNSLKELGCDCEFLKSVPLAGFTCGIRFPHDFVIDSAKYAQELLRESGAELIEGHRAVDINETKVTLDDGRVLHCINIIVATGGLWLDHALAGILRPCYSYLTAIETSLPSSANYFTFGFSHDWCVSNGYIRVSGEDHYSSLKPPQSSRRCNALADFIHSHYPDQVGAVVNTRYGVYSETPDGVPLVGSVTNESRIFYMVGCNAWGQASMSAVASLAPSLLGIRPMTPSEELTLALVTIRRFKAHSKI